MRKLKNTLNLVLTILTVFLLIFSMVLSAVTPALVYLLSNVTSAAATVPGSLKLYEGIGIDGGSLVLKEAQNYSMNSTHTMPVSVNGTSALSATTFTDDTGQELEPVKFKSANGDDIIRQSGGIGLVLRYSADEVDGVISNKKGYWRESSMLAMPQNAANQEVIYTINYNDGRNPVGKPIKSNIAEYFLPNSTQKWAQGETATEYSRNILQAYFDLSGEILTKHTVTYKYSVPSEVTKLLNEGKDVYVSAATGYMHLSESPITVKLEQSGSKYYVSVTTPLNPKLGYEAAYDGNITTVAEALRLKAMEYTQPTCLT